MLIRLKNFWGPYEAHKNKTNLNIFQLKAKSIWAIENKKNSGNNYKKRYINNKNSKNNKKGKFL